MAAELPRYLVLTRVVLRPARSTGSAVLAAGDLVAFEGEPGAALAPLNRAAFVAHRSARSLGLWGQKYNRLLGGLDSSQRAQVIQA